MIFQPVLEWWILAGIATVSLFFIVKQIIVNKKNKKIVFSWVRRSIILLLVILTAFRPGIGEFKEVETLTNQYDIYFVVDTTASIVAEDWGDNDDTRLSAAKSDIGRIVDEYAGARYALITFDSEGLLRTPITKNASALMTSVNILQPEITKYSTGSNLGAASDILQKTLDKSLKSETDRARIVFFFTDGEQTSQSEIISYANSATYIIGGAVFGYGTNEGGRMLKQNGYVIVSNETSPYIMDESVQPAVEAISKLDETNLQKISEELAVEYVIRDADTPLALPELSEVKLEASLTEMNVVTDLTWIVAFLVFIILALETSYMLKQYLALRLFKKGI